MGLKRAKVGIRGITHAAFPALPGVEEQGQKGLAPMSLAQGMESSRVGPAPCEEGRTCPTPTHLAPLVTSSQGRDSSQCLPVPHP